MRRVFENFCLFLSWLGTVILFTGIFLLLGYLLFRGTGGLSLSLLFGDVPPRDAIFGGVPVFDGLYAALLGTFALIVVAICIAIPFGVGTGIYLAEYARGRAKYILSLLCDVLAGLPSIVIGLFGFSLTILLHKLFPGKIGPCLLISAMALAFLVLPYIIRSTQGALESCPFEIRMAAPALGANKIQNITKVLLPYQLPKIISGMILAIGRAAEDTAVIMLTGAVVSAGVPRSFLEQFEALPFYIYYISSQYSDQHELQMGFSAAILLVMICAFLFVVAHLVGTYFSRRFVR